MYNASLEPRMMNVSVPNNNSNLIMLLVRQNTCVSHGRTFLYKTMSVQKSIRTA